MKASRPATVIPGETALTQGGLVRVGLREPDRDAPDRDADAARRAGDADRARDRDAGRPRLARVARRRAGSSEAVAARRVARDPIDEPPDGAPLAGARRSSGPTEHAWNGSFARCRTTNSEARHDLGASGSGDARQMGGWRPPVRSRRRRRGRRRHPLRERGRRRVGRGRRVLVPSVPEARSRRRSRYTADEGPRGERR